MNNEIYDDNAIFLSMVEAIEITNKDEENIAEVTRNLEQLKKKKERDIKKYISMQPIILLKKKFPNYTD